MPKARIKRALSIRQPYAEQILRGDRVLQQAPRSSEKHIGKERFIRWEDPIQHGNHLAFAVADLLGQAKAETGQFAQLEQHGRGRCGHLALPNADKVCNPEGIRAIILAFPDPTFASWQSRKPVGSPRPPHS